MPSDPNVLLFQPSAARGSKEVGVGRPCLGHEQFIESQVKTVHLCVAIIGRGGAVVDSLER